MSNTQEPYFKAITLGHYLNELPKSTLPASEAKENGHYPFYCSSSVIKYCNTYIQEKPTVLMGTGGVASVNFGNDKFAYSTDTWAFRSNDEDEVKTEYIYRLLQLKLPQIDYRAFEGSGLKHLRKNDVKKLTLRVPVNKHLTEKLLYIFRNIDTAIEKTEALIEKYQQIKAGLMHDLFTRGIGEDDKLRLPREEAPELYQETPIGWIPKDWKILELSTLCSSDITYGIVQAGVHVEDGVPYIRTGDMSGDFLDINSLLRTSPRIAESYKRSEVRAGEIVCAIRATVGKVLLIPQELDGANLTQGTARISPNSFINTNYVLWAFRSNMVQKEISLNIKGTTFNEITLGDLRKLRFPVPNAIEEQSMIANQLEALDKVISSENNNLIKLKALKAGLMHDLLTGKVQVPINTAEESNV